MKLFMSRIVIGLLLVISTVGCAPPQNSLFNYFVGINKYGDYLYLYADDKPVLRINDTYIPLLKDTRIVDTFFIDEEPVLQLTEDSGIGAVSVGGVYTGVYQWLYPNIILIKYDSVNGVKLKEPFDQIMAIVHIDDCTYELETITFGVRDKVIVTKCAPDVG